MDLTLIKKLSDKGVPADVILGIILDDSEKPEEPNVPQTVTAETPEPIAAKEQPPEPAKKIADDPVLAKLDKLIGVLQANAIMTSGRETAAGPSVDDILAGMIAPPKK